MIGGVRTNGSGVIAIAVGPPRKMSDLPKADVNIDVVDQPGDQHVTPFHLFREASPEVPRKEIPRNVPLSDGSAEALIAHKSSILVGLKLLLVDRNRFKIR
jgi:hypothetical protein